jgi:hypothetical protein
MYMNFLLVVFECHINVRTSQTLNTNVIIYALGLYIYARGIIILIDKQLLKLSNYAVKNNRWVCTIL